MSGFPKLIPAFTVNIVLDPPVTVGTVATGTRLVLARFTSSAGFLKSEPGYSVPVDATFVHGSDYIRTDPSDKYLRLEVKSVLKDKSGAHIKLDYDGIITLSSALNAIFSGTEDAKTTDFGDAVTHCRFETGSEELSALETKLYVGSGRFIVEDGKPLIVEYKISEIAP